MLSLMNPKTISRPAIFGSLVKPKFNSCRLNIKKRLKDLQVSDSRNKSECDIINIVSARRTRESGVLNNTSKNRARKKALKPKPITIPMEKKIVGSETELKSAPYPKKYDVKENEKPIRRQHHGLFQINQIATDTKPCQGKTLNNYGKQKTIKRRVMVIHDKGDKGELSADPCTKTTKLSKPNDCSSTDGQKKVLYKCVADGVPPPNDFEKTINPVSTRNKNSQESAGSATQKPKRPCSEKRTIQQQMLHRELIIIK
ncbi:Hypothetical protein CINCED_3A013944 [Cinara cedri]|uniref:Uncharacterized protein n=1 Tax=Cinara cedri TaxID=506608 RepID=A0A5E4NEF2_9HEMI|nr:Hypothetical protein CINCED_3A013944 [Cinara cedri]